MPPARSESSSSLRRYYDKTVVSKMPDMSKRVLSEKQKESNERMWLATNMAEGMV